MERLIKSKELLEYFENRFGLGGTIFSGMNFYAAGKKRIFLSSARPVQENPVIVGLAVARIGKKGSIKPTTAMIQLFGKYASKNILEISREQAIDYVNGKDLENVAGASDGYVIVRYKNYDLGCGLLRNNYLKNMLPKKKRLDVTIL